MCRSRDFWVLRYKVRKTIWTNQIFKQLLTVKYNTCTKISSNARLGRYLKACKGNKRKAMLLYRYNVQLSQRLYGVICIFEVMLRNAINDHYVSYFCDKDWIINNAGVGQLLEHETTKINETKNNYVSKGTYSNDKMVASFMFGFWTYLFTKHNYALGGKTLLRIFPNRIKNTRQKDVYREITEIREFRNRIAHHEPICFDNMNNPNAEYAKRHFEMIKKYISFMGYDADDSLSLAETPQRVLRKIENFKA